MSNRFRLFLGLRTGNRDHSKYNFYLIVTRAEGQETDLEIEQSDIIGNKRDTI